MLTIELFLCVLLFVSLVQYCVSSGNAYIRVRCGAVFLFFALRAVRIHGRKRCRKFWESRRIWSNSPIRSFLGSGEQVKVSFK